MATVRASRPEKPEPRPLSVGEPEHMPVDRPVAKTKVSWVSVYDDQIRKFFRAGMLTLWVAIPVGLILWLITGWWWLGLLFFAALTIWIGASIMTGKETK